jgi:hypothetical protein
MTEGEGRLPVLSGNDEKDRIGQLERELAAAKAEVGVKDEYIASLENELEQALALVPVLDAKVAYIASLPSVRLKVWLKGLRRRPEA